MMSGMPRHARKVGSLLGAIAGDNPALLGVALIGFSVSFQTISRLATAHHLPGWPVLYPVLIDVGIMAMVIESRRAIDARRSDLAPRVLAWALIGLTLYVNVHGSPPGDWLGRALHISAPALWAALLELTRWRKLARKRAEKGDPIPLSRWLVAPWRTAWLRRRMVLWNETSYRRAVGRQAVILYATAVAQADRRVGRTPLLWRRRLPVTLRWQLAEGKPPPEVERTLSAAHGSSVETWQAPASAWVAAALRMLPGSVSEGSREGTSQGTAGAGAGGRSQGSSRGSRQGTSRVSEWPESRTVDRAVLVRRTRAAMRRWEEKHRGQRLPATQLGAQLKLRMSRDTATALLNEAAGGKPRLERVQ